MAAGDTGLDQIHGDEGQPSVHDLYSWEINPALAALRDEIRSRQTASVAR